MKTTKAFTSGSVIKGARVAVAVEKTTLKRKQINKKKNMFFLGPPPSRGGGAGSSGLASRLQERKS